MKRALCLLLAFVLLLPATPCFAAGAPGEITLAVASDIHYNLPEETLTLLTDDPLYGHANRRAAMENESGLILDAFLADAAARGADYVLISGDLADHGRNSPEEHYAVRDKLLAFEEKTGIPVFVIDGNHDLGEGSAVGVAQFKEIYQDLGYDRALSVRAEDCSYTADLGDTLRLIALDSCDPAVSTADGMSAGKIAWAVREAKAARAAGRTPVLMMHHNLLSHLPAQRLLSRNFIVRAHLSTAELFADAGIGLVLTGHEHCSDAAVYTSALGGVIRDFATTSLTMYPLSYRLFTFAGEEVTYAARQIEKIDTAALAAAVSGYTPAVLSAMDRDLTAYAKAFLKKGVQYRLSLQLSADKSDLKAGSAAYELLDSLYGALKTLLERPLYGQGSAAELAAAYGITIPETPYATGWDLATEFVAAHYAGSENFDLTGPEITALLRLASLALKYAPESASDALFSETAAAVAGAGTLGEARALCRRTFGRIRPDEVLLAALLSGLVYGFTNDSDGLDDNNGAFTLPAAPARTRNLAAAWLERLCEVFRLIRNAFAVLAAGLTA